MDHHERSDGTEEPHGLSRRELIRLLSAALALPGGNAFFSAWLEAAPHQQSGIRRDAPPEPPLLRNYQPAFFEREDFGALQAFTEILIPTDDTPGARDARCAHFIDFVLQASAEESPETQKLWRQAMTALREAGFHAADAAQRTAIVAAVSRPEREPGAKHPAYFAYRLIKTQNTFAFYTSRAGLIEALDYRGNSYNATYPPCEHPEHRVL